MQLGLRVAVLGGREAMVSKSVASVADDRAVVVTGVAWQRRESRAARKAKAANVGQELTRGVYALFAMEERCFWNGCGGLRRG